MANTILIQGEPAVSPSISTIPVGSLFQMPNRHEWAGQVFMKVERDPYHRVYAVHLRTGKSMLVSANKMNSSGSFLPTNEPVQLVSAAVTIIPAPWEKQP